MIEQEIKLQKCYLASQKLASGWIQEINSRKIKLSDAKKLAEIKSLLLEMEALCGVSKK